MKWAMSGAGGSPCSGLRAGGARAHGCAASSSWEDLTPTCVLSPQSVAPGSPRPGRKDLGQGHVLVRTESRGSAVSSGEQPEASKRGFLEVTSWPTPGARLGQCPAARIGDR